MATKLKPGKITLAKLFSSPYKEIIMAGLPVFFSQEQIRHSRGGKTGMEVGNARERVLITLCMFVFGKENITVPPTTSAEEDMSVYGNPVSIKTKTGASNTGIKIKWTTDWDKVDEIVKNYKPSCDILLVKIVWDNDSGLYWIPAKVQKAVFKRLGRDKYFKIARRNTNPRGIELSKEAMEQMIAAPSTNEMIISWGTPDQELESQINDEYILQWEKISKANKL